MHEIYQRQLASPADVCVVPLEFHSCLSLSTSEDHIADSY